ncbi:MULTISPECIES: alpha/beta hydrolase [unclassified Exiguobacterium]|uniref:alpha/beta fold hydrolase n=1 Tax=unclassified Exiguobacterium TaxID=2644629 RepID=UPI0020369A55|nr:MULTISPECIES: alpha/beta hydrolase [unclassified Exiguobacterium]
MIEVNGYDVEYRLFGSGERLIVVMTGMGGSFEEWVSLSEQLSESYQILLYHRPGYGESEMNRRSSRTSSHVLECTELLNALQLHQPILVVGHSYGGLCAQHMAKVFPNRVGGVVLVDSTSHDFSILDDIETPVMDRQYSDEDWRTMCRSYSNLTKEELERLHQPEFSLEQQGLSSDVLERLKRFYQSPQLYKTMLEEESFWYDDASIIKQMGTFSSIPLIVIGRDSEATIEEGIDGGLPEAEIRLLEETWYELIHQQLRLSNQSELIIAEKAGHQIHLQRPDTIIEAIHRIEQADRIKTTGS